MAPQAPLSADPSLGLLLERVNHGDEDAFRDLHDLTHVRMTRVATDVLRSPEHAAEVVQELYLHVWQHSSAFDPVRGSALSWLTMIVRRRSVDRVRQVVSCARREERDAAMRDQVVPDSAEAGVARHEAARLRRAIARLGDHQREVVVLTYLQGYTQQQAAGLLDVPLGTVKTRARAGVISLRRHLEEGVPRAA